MNNFQALNARRQNERNAQKTHMVKRVNANGKVSQAKPTRLDWQMDAFTSLEGAERRKATLEKLNPGSTWTIITL